jgi:hypothetical protein
MSHPSSASSPSFGGIVIARVPLRGDALRDWDFDEGFANAMAQHLGIAPDGSKTQWVIGDAVLGVRLWRDKERKYVVRVLEGWSDGPGALCLGQAFSLWRSERLKKPPTGPALGRVKQILLVEFRFVEPAPVALAALPPYAPRHSRETWDIVRRLLEARWLGDPPDEPFAFSAPWIADHFGVSESTIRRGKAWLKKEGFLRQVDEKTVRFGRPLGLWRAKEIDP